MVHIAQYDRIHFYITKSEHYSSGEVGQHTQAVHNDSDFFYMLSEVVWDRASLQVI